MNNQIGKQELFHPDLGQPDTAPNQELGQTAKSLAPIVEELKSLSGKEGDNETTSQKLALLQRANAKLDELLKKSGGSPEVIDLERFDEKVVDFLERLYEETLYDVFPDNGRMAESLIGIDSDRAWEIRKKILEDEGENIKVIRSLTGLDSERAWFLREQEKGCDEIKDLIILESLAGLDTRRAWDFRQEAIDKEKSPDSILLSLVALDSEKAWSIREKYVFDKGLSLYIISSLAGLESERAWEMRKRLLLSGSDVNNFLVSLSGLDSAQAWDYRDKFYSDDKYRVSIAISLAGIDSDRAWKMRERMLLDGVQENIVALGLAGLDSSQSWSFREDIFDTTDDFYSLFSSLSGDKTTFVWRLIAKRKQEEARSKNNR